MLPSGGGHPALPFLQKLVKLSQSAWPSPKTKLLPPKCLVTVSYLPLVPGKRSSGSSQKRMVLGGLVIWLRRNPTPVLNSLCQQELIEYMKYGFVITGCTATLVELGHDHTLLVRGVGGVPAVYNWHKVFCPMYGGTTVNQAVSASKAQGPVFGSPFLGK